jgi:hypothetical protein
MLLAPRARNPNNPFFRIRTKHILSAILCFPSKAGSFVAGTAILEHSGCPKAGFVPAPKKWVLVIIGAQCELDLPVLNCLPENPLQAMSGWRRSVYPAATSLLPLSRDKKGKTPCGCDYFTTKVIVTLCDGTPLKGVAVSNMVYVPFASKLHVSVETIELPAPKIG